MRNYKLVRNGDYYNVYQVGEPDKFLLTLSEKGALEYAKRQYRDEGQTYIETITSYGYHFTETTILNVADIVEPNGKTWRENNLELMHKIPLGTLVEINCDYHAEHMMRSYVVKHGRDCDGSPLYVLGKKRECYEPYERDFYDHGGWGEESLISVGLNSTSICPHCGHNNGDYQTHMGNDWIGTDTCQACGQTYAYKMQVTTRYLTWEAPCITNNIHNFVIVGQESDISGSRERHILKYNKLECTVCGITEVVRRPDIIVGDKVELVADVFDEVCEELVKIASKGQKFKVKEIVEGHTTQYILVSNNWEIVVPRTHFIEINF